MGPLADMGATEKELVSCYDSNAQFMVVLLYPYSPFVGNLCS